MAIIECLLGSFVIFRGSGPALLRKPIFFVLSGGGGGGLDPLSPPLDPHMSMQTDQRLVIRFVKSIISKLATSEISSF